MSEVENLHNWNPMEEDYFSKRNIYKIDDEDAGLALEGYSKFFIFLSSYCSNYNNNYVCLSESTSRICRFYASGKRCFDGENCRFLHVQGAGSIVFQLW